MEFYLSAKHLDEGETFWTKAYFDPVTHVRMITVVSPIYKDKTTIFYGKTVHDVLSNQFRYQIRHIVRNWRPDNCLYKKENQKYTDYPGVPFLVFFS